MLVEEEGRSWKRWGSRKRSIEVGWWGRDMTPGLLTVVLVLQDC